MNQRVGDERAAEIRRECLRAPTGHLVRNEQPAFIIRQQDAIDLLDDREEMLRELESRCRELDDERDR